jgi:hypothetical protein
LGEIFSFYVKVSNDSSDVRVTDVTVRIDLQVTTRVINLKDTSCAELPHGQSFHQLIHHEIKEMGANVLICTISYKIPDSPSPSETSSFRKFFKFHVEKPLDVKTKFYNAEVSFRC